MRIYTWKKLFALILGLGMSVGTVRAGLLPTDVTYSAEGGAYRFTYSVTLTSDLELHPGDFFTIYDFAGFIPGSNTQPANFTFSSDKTGPTPSRVSPDDNPGIENLTWTYNGPITAIGQDLLGDFTALSIYGNTQEDSFTARTHRVVGGSVDSNITDTTVPVPCGPQVPEPTTLLLIAAGLPVCGAAHWLKKRRRA
jgi:hypothetical protein